MKKVVKVFIITILAIVILTNFSFGTDATNINEFTGKTTSVANNAGEAFNSVFSIIQVIGIAVAVIMLIVLGIKYMVSSVSDRAEIKKHAVVYVVGAILLFGASGIVEIIKNFSKSVK